jgi:hypothetical protein
MKGRFFYQLLNDKVFSHSFFSEDYLLFCKIIFFETIPEADLI